MKKLFGDEELEEARSSASPVQNITSCNRSANFGVKKYVIFQYPDRQHRNIYGRFGGHMNTQ
jgi:hypothetical protein